MYCVEAQTEVEFVDGKEGGGRRKLGQRGGRRREQHLYLSLQTTLLNSQGRLMLP